jgi:hypothetical protein
VGIAFDGTNLWYSCYRSNPDLFRANATTGAVTASYNINSGLGALAYDSRRNIIWAARGGSGNAIRRIYLDASRNVTRHDVAFTISAVLDLDDGLAIDLVSPTDPSQDVLYYGPDTATTVRVFNLSGRELRSFRWAGSGCYKSGLAVGGNLLYQGSDGCAHVWVVNKTSLAPSFNFTTRVSGDPNFRDEDLECDSHTFAARGKHVMWSMEAYEPRRAHAFEIPFGTCGTGGAPPVLRPPSFVPPTPAANSTIDVTAGSPMSFIVRALDPDAGDRVTLGVSGLPAGASFPIPVAANPVQSTFSWTPSRAQGGTYRLVFTAVSNSTKPGDRAPDHVINIRVLVPNRPPVFVVPPTPANGSTLTVDAGSPLTFRVRASDPDAGDTVRLSVAGMPAGASFPIPAPANPVESGFSWTPGPSQAGSYRLTFTATDNLGATATHTINILVRGNNPPVFVVPPTPPNNSTLTVESGSPLAFRVRASDPDAGDTVRLSVAGMPAGASFPIPAPANPVESGFSWTPTSAQAGSYTLTFTATDRLGATATHTINLRVVRRNNPPVFVVPPTPPNDSTLSVDFGNPLTFRVRASDPDEGDTVRLSVVGLPSGSSFPIPAPANPVESGFSWTPTYAQIGSYTLTFTATDNLGATATHRINIRVTGVDTTPPECRVTAMIPGPPRRIEVTIQDRESGLARITVLQAYNLIADVPSFARGTTAPVIVRATKVDPAVESVLVMEAVDVAGNRTECDPVSFRVDPGQPVAVVWAPKSLGKRYYIFQLDNYGIDHMYIYVNDAALEFFATGETILTYLGGPFCDESGCYGSPYGVTSVIDITDYLVEGENFIYVEAEGPSDSHVDVDIMDVDPLAIPRGPNELTPQ